MVTWPAFPLPGESPVHDAGVEMLECALADLDADLGELSSRRIVRLSGVGRCLSLVLGDPEQSLERQQRLVCEGVAEAARRSVGLLAGSSFGFDTTRIYLTAARAEYGTPFVQSPPAPSTGSSWTR